APASPKPKKAAKGNKVAAKTPEQTFAGMHTRQLAGIAQLLPPGSLRKAAQAELRKRQKATEHQRRVAVGGARGLTPQQAAGKPRPGELHAKILEAPKEALVNPDGSPTDLLAAELRRFQVPPLEGKIAIEQVRELLIRLGYDTPAKLEALFRF